MEPEQPIDYAPDTGRKTLERKLSLQLLILASGHFAVGMFGIAFAWLRPASGGQIPALLFTVSFLIHWLADLNLYLRHVRRTETRLRLPLYIISIIISPFFASMVTFAFLIIGSLLWGV